MAPCRSLLLLSLFGGFPATASAERIQIRMGEPLARFDKLHAGTNTYLRHWIKADGTLEMMDLETKEVRFEMQDGKRRVHIVQHWTTPKAALTIDSLFEDKTLRPIRHERITTKDGKTTRAGYRFLPDRVVGIAEPENSQKDFEIETPVPTFNFEVDLETFATLPLHWGAEFEINFYHPGGEPPAPYVYKVIGEEKLTVAGMAIDCWVLANDYGKPGPFMGTRTRFWLAKDSQTVVRVHAALPDGSAVVKALLPSTQP